MRPIFAQSACVCLVAAVVHGISGTAPPLAQDIHGISGTPFSSLQFGTSGTRRGNRRFGTERMANTGRMELICLVLMADLLEGPTVAQPREINHGWSVLRPLRTVGWDGEVMIHLLPRQIFFGLRHFPPVPEIPASANNGCALPETQNEQGRPTAKTSTLVSKDL